jgi:xanthine dehydrogenase large subunit
MPSIGKAIPHDSARGHVTGTAAYIDDLPAIAGELHVDFAGAPTAHGTVLSIDIDEASQLPGVVGIYTAKDLPGSNVWGPIFHDEPILVERDVSYLGQPVVVVAATTKKIASAACKLVRIECEAKPPVFTIDEAIEADDFIGPTRKIERGDVDAAFDAAPHTIEGVLENNGQEQLYFESQAALTIPGEDGCLKVLSSTQSTTEVQAEVAGALGIGMHQVVCECTRMGGGFGGKETQTVIPAVIAALVSVKTGKSARVIYAKDRDMQITGKRHQCKSWYRVAFDDDGRLIAVDFRFFSNGGAFADLSTAVMERTMMHCDNAYYFPHVRITGQVCRTNLPPNTAFRGFGGPQGVIAIENALQDIAAKLGMDSWDVRQLNLYRDGDEQRNKTPYGQTVRDHVLLETFEQLEEASDYRRRVRAAEEFSASSSSHIRGVAMSPIKFGISFTTKFLNQGNALVNLYTDGTVQVSTGGTEMGQGLNTKIRQLVADEFDIDPSNVKLMPTSTEKSNNTSPTAASAGTDLNGSAAVKACREIRKRLAVFAAEHFASLHGESPDVNSIELGSIEFRSGEVMDSRHPKRRIGFGTLCDLARRERVDLGERAFYATPGIHFDRETGKGEPFFYFTTGAAVSEVTIDRFTGEMTVDRVDMLMDVGEMINPGVDHGQMIGGFVQGMGWVTNEQLVYDLDSGRLLSTSPTTYKIPNITDVPPTFNVHTINNPNHTINVRRSKAVGEPPLMLGISVWLAAKHAIESVAKEAVALDIPATSESNLRALEQISRKKIDR